jgi:flagellar motor switch protein FliN/FliY
MSASKDKSDKQSKVRPLRAVIDTASSRRSRLRKSADAVDDVNPPGIEFLWDIPLKVSVVLAETKMPVRELLALGTDSVVQLNKLSGDPVDIYVENQKLGKGEVIVLQEKLRIRLLEITPPSIRYEPPMKADG